MAHFVELTQEKGARIAINVDHVVNFSALGGDPHRGTAISFGFAAGEKYATRTVRVKETYADILTKFSRGR